MLNPIEIKSLDWDSDFFGFKVARANLKECSRELLEGNLGQLKKEGFRLVYVFADPQDAISNNSCSDTKGFLADEKVTYKLEKLTNIQSSDHIQKYSDKLPVEQLYSLALLSGEYSRFKLDPQIDKGKFESMYALWIENSVNGKIADEVLVYVNKSDILGFVSLSLKEVHATIGLIAVDPEYQGLNIGRELVNACINRALRNKLSSIEVVTQKSNIGACKFYIKCGFSVLKIENIYHFWI